MAHAFGAANRQIEGAACLDDLIPAEAVSFFPERGFCKHAGLSVVKGEIGVIRRIHVPEPVYDILPGLFI